MKDGKGPRKGPGHGPIQMSGGKPKDFKKTFKELFAYLGKYKLSVILVLLFAVGSAIFSIFGPKILGTATTEIFNGLIAKVYGTGEINLGKISTILIWLLCLYIVSTIFSLVQGFIMSKVAQDVSYQLRKEISLKFNRLPMKYFDSKTTGDVLSRVTNDVDTVSQNLNQSLTQVITSITMLIGILIMMFSIDFLMTIISLMVVPIAFIFFGIIFGSSQKYFVQQQEYLGVVNSKVEETYGGHNIIKAFNGEESVIGDFNESNETLCKVGFKSQFLSGLMMPIMGFIGNLGYVIVSIFGGWLVIKNRIQVGDIVTFSQYIRNFMHPLSQIAQVSTMIQSTLAAFERVSEFLKEEEEVQDIENPVKIDNIKGNVQFDSVHFGYNPDKIVINNFSTKVKEGAKIAIVGPTGAGKTTMIKLLMRFYDVNSGKIMIDGNDIKDFNRSDLRSLFGMVLQDTWLFSGSIMDNIRYGKLNADDEEVYDAAMAAHIDHFIKTLPDGYNMILNEEASNISQGQKQLLTIARVILANPKILILDEATSSVDTRTEVLIQKAMDNLMKGRTSFIIAHRLSTIKNADLILVMDKGDIVEVGKHTDLLEKDGFYAKLYNSQFEEA